MASLAEEVQTLKDRWLKRNFGNKDDLTNYLLKISNGVLFLNILEQSSFSNLTKGRTLEQLSKSLVGAKWACGASSVYP